MVTLRADITASQTILPVSTPDVDPGSFYTIGSEAIRVFASGRDATGRSFERRFWSVERGIAGTTAASHSSGATLTRYYPDANSSGGAGSVTADQQAALNAADPPLDADHPPLTGQSGGPVQAYVETASGNADSNIRFTAVTAGAAGNDITVIYDGNGVGAVTLEVVGDAITVLHSGITTANELIAAMVADEDVSALIVPTLAEGNDGTGLLGGDQTYPLAAGADATDLLTISPRGTTTLRVTDPNEPALSLRPAPGSTTLGTAVLQLFDDAGNKLGDWDATGHIQVGGGSTGSLSLDPIGRIIAQLGSGMAPGDQAFSVGGFAVRKNGGGSVAQIGTNVVGDKVLILVSNEDDEHGVPILEALGPPNWNGEFRVLAGGAIVTSQHVAPADGVLRAGDMSIWFDQTDGAAKLKIKGKSADGTVVAGEVALT